MSSLTTAARVSRDVRALSLGGLCWALCCAATAGLMFLAAAPDGRMPSGSGPGRYTTKSIEDVRAGERVWAYDVGSGRWAPREVVRPLAHDYEGDVVTVAAAGERIEATGNHPFWVVGGDGLAGRPPAEHVPAAEQDEAWRSGKGRWVDARHLQVGDLLLLRGGELATVEELASRREKLKVYNLEVADLHTYAVGSAGVVVHNKAMSNSGPNGPYDVVGPPTGRFPTRFIDDVTVTDRKTGATLRGTVDLKPTIDRMASGGKFPHKNDGLVYKNRSGALPAKPERYYREYVHPTPGINGPGPQRLVRGDGGEMYYTPDHYRNFIPIN